MPEAADGESEVQLSGEELVFTAYGVDDIVKVHHVGVADEAGGFSHPLEDVGDLDWAGKFLELAVLQYEFGCGNAGGLVRAADAHSPASSTRLPLQSGQLGSRV